MTVRTLQRRLRAEKTGYKQILDDVRRELAVDYVSEPDLSIKEITYMLGFSEPSNFTRAFKRWTGTSPNAYRAVPDARGRELANART
jgi:AraC-like DNA-binding protein